MLATSDKYKVQAVKGTRTSAAVISFGVFDVTAKDDATPSANGSQPFTSVSSVTDELDVSGLSVGTLEQDYFKLDGSLSLMPDDVGPSDELGWWSAIQSNFNRWLSRRYTFARTSTAYKFDGTVVASGVPRIQDKGVFIEEGTTNIVASVNGHGSSWVLQGYKYGDLDVYRNTVTSPGVGNNFGFRSTTVVQLSAVKFISLSFLVNVITNPGNIGGYIRVRYTDATEENLNWSYIPLSWWNSHGWQLVTATAALNTNKTPKEIVNWYVYRDMATVGTMDVAGIQLEQKPYVTSFHPTTRAAETLTIPTTGVITPTAGTIDIRVRIGAHQRRKVAGQWPTIFRVFRGDATNNAMLIFHSPSTSIWTLETRNDASVATSINFNDTLTPDGVLLFTVSYNAQQAKVFINGTLIATINTPNLPSAFNGLQMGASGSLSLNSTFHEIRCSSVARSDAEIAVYGSSPTLPDDEFTTYKANFIEPDNLTTTPPELTISFSGLHSSLGVGVIFAERAICTEFDILWYNGANLLEQDSIRGNTAQRAYSSKGVENYNKVVIRLLKTDKPYRYARILEVDFGTVELFDSDNIISASIVEEVDPIGAVLSVNKLKFTVLNEQQKFNMLNPEGLYAHLQRRQPIVARSGLMVPDGSYEFVSMGVYYLSDWKNASGLTATLEATDLIGLADKTVYYSSPFWVNAPFPTVLNHILADAGLPTARIAPEMVAEVVNGYTPVMSHREAIQTLLIASSCVLRVDRDGRPFAFRPDYTSPVVSATYDTIIGSPSIEQKPVITAVETKDYSYSLNAVVETLNESSFILNGQSTVVIPYEGAAANVLLGVTGNGSVVGSPAYSATSVTATINGTGSLTVTVTGKRYVENVRNVRSSLPSLPAGEIPQVAVIADNNLISGKGAAVTQKALDYYQRRIKQSFDYWSNPSIQAGDCIEAETMFIQSKSGVVERQEITFAPKLVARVEVTG